MLTAVSGDDRYKEMAMLTKDKAWTQEGKGVVTMRSQFIDNIWKRAKDEGEKIGELRGERRQTIRGMKYWIFLKFHLRNLGNWN